MQQANSGSVVRTSSKVDISSHVKRLSQIQSFRFLSWIHRLQVAYTPCERFFGSHTLGDLAVCGRMDHSKEELRHVSYQGM